MRDAVAATGLQFKELHEYGALNIGCVSALQRLQRAGRLSCQEFLCQAAAKGGHLEVLQWARANGCPWDNYTLINARHAGHLELVNWATANGCP
jgi:hypothetical protein